MQQLSTFNDAIAASGLADTLAGEGPFTVFAPTDQAFAQLPQPLLSKLLEEGHQAELTKLLEHHLIDGKAVTAKDLAAARPRSTPRRGIGSRSMAPTASCW